MHGACYGELAGLSKFTLSGVGSETGRTMTYGSSESSQSSG